MLYKDILKKFNDNKYILTTEEDIKELTKEKFQSHIKVDFIAKCGHNNSVVLTNFILRNTGVNCKECIIKINREKNKLLENNNTSLVNEASIYHYMEYTGFCKISKLIENNFIIKKTNEGYKADFIIKPKNLTNLESKWLMIQLKITQTECHNMYGFNINNNYNHMLLYRR
jgi:hypothetical protein